MAFKLYSTDDGHVPAWEYLPCSAMKPQIGMGLAVNETTGLLAVSTTPKYIAMRVEDKNVASGTLIPVVKIDMRPIGDGKVGPVTKNLIAHFRDLIVR